MSRRIVPLLVLTAILIAQPACRTPQRTATAPPPQKRDPVPLRVHLASREAEEGYTATADQFGAALYVAPEPLATEEDVINVTALYGEQRNVVVFELDALATERLALATRRSIGRWLAIYLDDEFLLASRIRTPVVRGKVAINAGFSRARVEQILRAYGAGPAE